MVLNYKSFLSHPKIPFSGFVEKVLFSISTLRNTNPKHVMTFINAKWGSSLSLINDLFKAKYIAAGTLAKMRDMSTSLSPDRCPDLSAFGSSKSITVPIIATIAP